MMRKKASCSSEEYCPGGWSVKRIQEDYSARTCDPMDKSAANKCPKPYMCVASKCGINFVVLVTKCSQNWRKTKKIRKKRVLKEISNEPQSSSFGQSPSSNPHLKECKKECVDWLIYNMTVSYHLDIATTGTFAFFKVLLRWRSSIWKRTLVDMVAWIAVYSLVSVFYRLVLFGRGQFLAFSDSIKPTIWTSAETFRSNASSLFRTKGLPIRDIFAARRTLRCALAAQKLLEGIKILEHLPVISHNDTSASEKMSDVLSQMTIRSGISNLKALAGGIVERVFMDPDRSIQNSSLSPYFETLAHYLDTHLGMFPVNLILGFFVMIVFKRWEGIFNNIGLIDDCAYNVSAYIPGDDPEITMLRRNILRYICLSQVLVLRDVSMSVKLRFPNMAAVEDAGYLQNEELNILMRNGKGYDKKYWVPLVWANQLIMKLAAEKKFLVNLLCCICLGQLANSKQISEHC
uniref:Bestrophin homolog n=1 Tax=Ditylenchus dipsaci TaxID=166011 RepID=A0A915CZT0_9BILA